MKKQFIHNAVLMTAAALLTRGVGVLFRIYATNKIGAVGIGLFSLVMTVYAFCAAMTTAAFNLAATRLVTDELAEKSPAKAIYSLRLCLILCVGFSLFVAALMYLGARPTAELILKDERCILPLKILAFSLPFMSVSACLRGYFFARRKAFFSASEQLIEQIAEIAVFALLINKMLPLGIEYGCCAIVIGTTAAEVVSFIYSAVLCVRDMRGLGVQAEKSKGFLKRFLAIGLPVTASSCLRSGLSLAENVMIPAGLSKYGSDREASLAQYGEIVGLAMPLLTFPDVFLYCFTTLMIPEMSDAKVKHRVNGISHMAGRVFGVACAFSLGVAVFFGFFGAEIAMLVFNDEDVGLFIRLLAPIIPLIYMDKVVDGMLKGLGEQTHYLMYNILDSVVRVTLTVTLLPVLGVFGVVVVLYVSAILNSGLSIARLIKVARVEVNPLRRIFLPLLCAFAICFVLQFTAVSNAAMTAIFRCLAFALTYLLVNFFILKNR